METKRRGRVRRNRAAAWHSGCLLKRRGENKAFSQREAERRDLRQLLEVVIRGIYENVKGTPPLSPGKTSGRVWQALSAETLALTRRERKVFHLTASVSGHNCHLNVYSCPCFST